MATEYSDRLEATNQKILDVLDSMDPSDPDFVKKAEAVTKLYAEINKEIDVAQTAGHNFEMEKLEVARQELEAERLDKEEARDRKNRHVKIAEIGVAAVTFGLGIFFQNKWIDKSTRKENPEYPETYDTMTDRTIVQDGLRGPKFKLPWFK